MAISPIGNGADLKRHKSAPPELYMIYIPFLPMI